MIASAAGDGSFDKLCAQAYAQNLLKIRFHLRPKYRLINVISNVFEQDDYASLNEFFGDTKYSFKA